MNYEFAVSFAVVAVGMAFCDAFWTMYVTQANERRAQAAGFSSIMIVLINSYVVLEYVHDRRLVIAAALGAYVGTVVPIKWKIWRAGPARPEHPLSGM